MILDRATAARPLDSSVAWTGHVRPRYLRPPGARPMVAPRKLISAHLTDVHPGMAPADSAGAADAFCGHGWGRLTAKTHWRTRQGQCGAIPGKALLPSSHCVAETGGP